MSTVIRDLWPDDIKSEDVVSPKEILRYQADQLTRRTNGLLVGHLERSEGEDRVVIGFEAESPRTRNRIRLFEVQHRLEFEYPVVVIPPAGELPAFLKPRVYHSGGPSAAIAAIGEMTRPGKWVKNEWVASSPSEFSENVEKVLARAEVKAIVLSLLSRANPDESANVDEETES